MRRRRNRRPKSSRCWAASPLRESRSPKPQNSAQLRRQAGLHAGAGAIRRNELTRNRWSPSSWAASRIGTPCASADETLTKFGVPHECRVLSAHRTPHADGGIRRPGRIARHGSDHRRRRRRGASGRGLRRPHLLPVLGVPMESAALKGLDSLLSTVQMPGRHSGGHAGHRHGGRAQRGAAGGRDSGQLAARNCAKSCGITVSK